MGTTIEWVVAPGVWTHRVIKPEEFTDETSEFFDADNVEGDTHAETYGIVVDSGGHYTLIYGSVEAPACTAGTTPTSTSWWTTPGSPARRRSTSSSSAPPRATTPTPSRASTRRTSPPSPTGSRPPRSAGRPDRRHRNALDAHFPDHDAFPSVQVQDSYTEIVKQGS